MKVDSRITAICDSSFEKSHTSPNKTTVVFLDNSMRAMRIKWAVLRGALRNHRVTLWGIAVLADRLAGWLP